jgi:hypothetical protein
MTLERYIDLIRSLPYLDQAFETKMSSWERERNSNKRFNEFCNTVFVEASLKLSRQDLFSAAMLNPYKAIILIIFWGYPRNMRGNNFSNIIKCIEDIQGLFNAYNNWTIEEFTLVSSKLKGRSIGLSTLSKMLYFFQITIDNKKCLILDRRIIDVLNSGLYEDLMSLKHVNDYNKVKLYPEYLTLMSDTANALKAIPDQLEYFLFLFGTGLKPDIDLAMCKGID